MSLTVSWITFFLSVPHTDKKKKKNIIFKKKEKINSSEKKKKFSYKKKNLFSYMEKKHFEHGSSEKRIKPIKMKNNTTERGVSQYRSTGRLGMDFESVDHITWKL